jgi:hypothetical protein
MSKRRNFTRAVKVEIVKRSMIKGVPTCEAVISSSIPVSGFSIFRCGCTKGLQVHHNDMDAMQVDKTRKLTAADGELLCKDHHDPITKKQKGVLKKVLKVEAAHLGVKRDKQPVPQRPKSEKPPAKVPVPGRTGIARQFVSIGDVGSGLLAKLNPKKAAE